MVKHFGMVTLMVLGLAVAAPPADAQYAAPPPPPAPTTADVPPPAPVRIRPDVRVRCRACTIRCPGTPRTPRTRVIYRTRYRRCPRCACPRPRRRYNKRLHRRGGPYYGFGLGYFGLLKPGGAYQHLRPKVMLSAHLGWNVNPIFAVELGYQGGLFDAPDQALGAIKNPGLFGVTLDLKFRFIRPRRYSRVIPYLQTGLGVYYAQAKKKALTDCGKDKLYNMAYGGGVQVGGGIDFYLSPWMVLGAKVLYRPLFMSALRCGTGASAPCGEAADNPLRKLHGLTAELTLAITWPG